jgi:hypothetical protein
LIVEKFFRIAMVSWDSFIVFPLFHDVM